MSDPVAVRRRAALSALVALLLWASAASCAAPPPARLGPDLTVSPLVDRVWLHVSAVEMAGSRVWSNGLVVRTRDGWILVDTPWNDEQTGRLLSWARQMDARGVALAVVTHSHEDRAGGIRELARNRIPVRALTATAARLVNSGSPLPRMVAGVHRESLGGVDFELFYPGAGHTRDNLTVWFPEMRLLHGGCFIKGSGSRTIGNISEADLGSWPASIARLRGRYPSARLIVPGHGETGGPELLDLTLRLVEASRPRR